jgi:WW domain-containing oxidoreductase
VIATNLGRRMSAGTRFGLLVAAPLFMKSVGQGAATQTWAAVHPDAAKVNGEYLSDCNVSTSSAHGQDKALAEKLWSATEEIVARVGGAA